MLRTIERNKENVQIERSNTDYLEHSDSSVPVRDSDIPSSKRFFTSSYQIFLSKEETGKDKLSRMHKKIIQEINEKGGIQENPIEKMSSILGRIKIGSRKLEKIIFDSRT